MKCVWMVMCLLPVLAFGQGGKFKEGFIVDRSGARYNGLLRFEPGTATASAKLYFKEDKRGKTETYGPSYVKSFKIESDSFTILKNITIPKQKVKAEDFVRVLLVAPGGTIYEYEFDINRTSDHAASDFKVTEENTRYLYSSKGKLVVITAANFRDVGNIVSDCVALKTKILNRKLKYADLLSAVEEYKSCKSESAKSK